MLDHASVISCVDTADEAFLRAVIDCGERPPPAAIAAGQIVDGTFLITRRLGAGGMGVVYLALDLELGREVALKLHASAVVAANLRREAATVAQLSHPHVVTVYRVGSHAGHPYVAMEYVPGGTARSWAAARRPSWREVVALYRGAGLGLAAAHAAGLVHRDVKPDNILVGVDGRARIADFGLADRAGSSSGGVMGTPAYMAPEQHGTSVISAAADQYAFCVAFWEALNGRRPESPAELRGGDGPRWLRRILARGAHPDPARRWPSMMALIGAIDAAQAGRRRAAGAASFCAAAMIALALGWAARDAIAPAAHAERPETVETASLP
jgi:serine/threonine protein kinase